MWRVLRGQQMAHNLFFMDHDHKEAGGDDGGDSKSKSNEFEARMSLALAAHLIHQGYARGTVWQLCELLEV